MIHPTQGKELSIHVTNLINLRASGRKPDAKGCTLSGSIYETFCTKQNYWNRGRCWERGYYPELCGSLRGWG
jgi:hypothetical protein